MPFCCLLCRKKLYTFYQNTKVHNDLMLRNKIEKVDNTEKVTSMATIEPIYYADIHTSYRPHSAWL